MPENNANVNADQIQDLFGSIDESYVPQQTQESDRPTEMLVEYPEEVAAQPEEGQPANTADERYRYWQSQHDKLQAELAAYKQYLPMIQFINQNPEALTLLQQQIVEKQFPKNPEEELVMPKAPVRPEGYNDYDAYNEPDSPSFKYRVERDEYNVQLNEYLVKKDRYREQAYIAQQQQLAFEQQQKQIMQQTYQMLTAQYGLNQNEALEFVQMFSDNRSINMDNLVDLYRLKKRQIAEPNYQAQRKWSPVPPVAQTTMQVNRNYSDEQRFNDSLGLYSWKNQRR
jgi:hypothetical protein